MRESCPEHFCLSGVGTSRHTAANFVLNAIDECALSKYGYVGGVVFNGERMCQKAA
jgi:hypothetical protein